MKGLITIAILFIWISVPSLLSGQENNIDDSTNFFDYQKDVNSFYKENPNAGGFNQWKRKEWFYAPRLYPSGKTENLARKTLKIQNTFLKSIPQQKSTHGSWTFLGPYDHINNSGDQGGKGRINSIAFHPTNDQIIYAGTSHGGLWKTENGGTTWSNKSPRIPLLAISDVVIDPNNTNHIYIATGDPHPCRNCYGATTGFSTLGSPSLGIIRSTDGGNTWNPNSIIFTGSADRLIYKLVIHPTNSLIQMAATDRGILYTDNAWSTSSSVSSFETFDIEFKPNNPNIVYASRTTTLIRSTDGGLSWNSVTDSDFPSPISFSRTELAVSPANPNGVYVIYTSATGPTSAILRSTSSGTSNSWTLMDTASTRFGGQGYYNLAMTVRPDDFTSLFVGKVSFGKSTNSGTINSWTTNLAGHSDIHDLQIVNGNLYCANDGGLYKSSNYGDSWTEISKGIGNTEIYRMSGTSQNNGFFLIGAQDNGTLKRTNSSTTFTSIAGADGMTNMIDYTNADKYIASGQSGFFYKTTTGGTADINITPGDGAAWVTPAVMDPVNPNILFVGKDSIYRSINQGDSWTWFQGPILDNINVLAQGTSNRNRLYASLGSNIWQMNSALVASDSTSWTNIGNGLPNLFISDIVVNPNNSTEVFITMSGYSDGDKVFQSQNAGASWDNISVGLPNVPANCIAYHDDGTGNDRLYVGTDIGVFYRSDDLGEWIYFSNDLPSVPVTDLYIHTSNNTIAASTYGRGLWRSSLYSSCVTNLTLTSGILVGGVHHYSVSNTITSTVDHYKDLGTEIKYSANNYIDLKENFDFGGHGLFIGVAGEGCPN